MVRKQRVAVHEVHVTVARQRQPGRQPVRRRGVQAQQRHEPRFDGVVGVVPDGFPELHFVQLATGSAEGSAVQRAAARSSTCAGASTGTGTGTGTGTLGSCSGALGSRSSRTRPRVGRRRNDTAAPQFANELQGQRPASAFVAVDSGRHEHQVVAQQRPDDGQRNGGGFVNDDQLGLGQLYVVLRLDVLDGLPVFLEDVDAKHQVLRNTK